MTDPTLKALAWAIDRATEEAKMFDTNLRHSMGDQVVTIFEDTRRLWSYVLALKGLRDRLIQEERENEDLMNTLSEAP